MKHIVNLAIFLISLTLLSQNTREENVGDFNEIKVYDLIEVNLIKSDNNKVVITGDDIENVEIINKAGKLKIRMKFDNPFNGSRTFVAVYYTKLDIIDGNEGAFISSNDLIKQDYIELKAQEGARLKIKLDVNNVDIKAVSGGVIETDGKANSQDVKLNTGGIYKGKTLVTMTTKVHIQAAGEAEVNASKTMNAKVRAGGNIYIYGNPESVNTDTKLGGRIKLMN